METPDVTLEDVRAAAVRIAPYIHRTPIVESRTLSQMTRTRLGLKAENLQRTGAFKARGALNAILRLTQAERDRGVITLSAGNHGQGLAYAAQLAAVHCVVFMPEHAVPTKVAAVKAYGAEAHFAPSMETVFAIMDEYREAHGLHYVHPFGDPDIIAGQGTVGLEILEDSPDVETIAVCVGGGGLLAGIAVAAKAIKPGVRIVGVEPEGAPVVTRSLVAGYPVTIEKITTIADGLAAPFAAPTSQRLIERYVDDVVIVTDDEILVALRLLLERTKMLVEPAGAAATAAFLTGRAGVPPNTRSVATLSGGNIDFENLKRLL
ncbi:MAG: pyridoxal-phosphate dependent enzyme [Chloroflexia bacterium]|nr:pyridoxal-phosphate dependent enzyme [Chloroflexia bacterium]